MFFAHFNSWLRRRLHPSCAEGGVGCALLRAAALGCAMAVGLARAEDGEVVAVYSSVSPGYARVRLADGTFRAETYAFGEGGSLSPKVRDDSIDRLKFRDIARIIAPALAAKSYLPSPTRNPIQADLLILVYWGATAPTDQTSNESQYQIAQALVPPPLPAASPPPTGQGGTAMVSDPGTSGRSSEGQSRFAQKVANQSLEQESLLLTDMANRQRDRQDAENAAILGYLPELQRTADYQMTALSHRREDILSEVEEGRYYVVLLAYDFPALANHRGKKLLWETRFSIRGRHNAFDERVAEMVEAASRYFGQDSKGLTRTTLPDGHVELGDIKVLGFEAPAK